jgi:hypothetical protein
MSCEIHTTLDQRWHGISVMHYHGLSWMASKTNRKLKSIGNKGHSPRSCCQGDRKILIYMKKTYKTKIQEMQG